MYEEIIELINKGEINKAQEQVEKISDDDPKKYNLKGLIHFNKKELEKAKEEFEKGLKINPIDSDLLFNYGYLLKEMNQESQAWRYLMRIHDKDWATYDLLGDIEFKNRSKLASLRFYLKAAELTDNPQMKKKFLEIRNKIKKGTKIAFLCLPGLDNFLKDIVETFSLGYNVKLVVSTHANEITEAIKWADIVWLEWANDLAVFATNKVPEIVNKKVICRLHSYEVFAQFAEKINWENIDQLIFVSEQMKKIFHQLHHNLDLQSCKEEIVYNGVDLDKFKFSIHKPGYNLAVLAHINYKKNPAAWIQIIGKLKEIDSKYKLHIAGNFQDPRYKVYFEYIKKEMKMEDNFILYGWINEVEKFLEDKNCIISTSIHESFGYNIAEAMARGIKPIIHNFDGAKTLWPNELIYNTIDEAVEKITEESYDSESYRRFIEDNYTLERQIYEIEEILNTSNKDRVKGQTILLNAKEKDINPNVINANVSERNLRDEEKHKNQFGKIWDKYSQIDSFQLMNEPGNKTLRSELIRLLNSYFLLRNAKVLEVGTGTGSFSFEIAMREAKVTGIDIEESAIRLAKRIAQDFEITNNIDFSIGDGFNLKKEGFRNFDIVFNMGVLEHFEDKLIVKMLKEMGQAGKFVVVGVPWSGSQIYKLSKQFSKASGTWEYGDERDFHTLREYFEQAGLHLLHESIIGGISETYYLQKVNPNAIKTAQAIYFEKFFKGEQTGSWLIDIGTKDKKYADLFSNLKNNQRIFFTDNTIQIMDKKQSPISVVIPVYNGEKFVESCFENIIKLDYENYEILFVNDGSTDNTLGVLKELISKYQYVSPIINIINLPENKGTFIARAKGIQNSGGDFIFSHNIDDIIYTNSLKYLNEDYQNFKSTNPLLTVSCALMQNKEFLGEVWYSLLWKNKRQVFANEFNHLHGNMTMINTLFKKQVLENAYMDLSKILTTLGVKKLNNGEDSILSDYMLANNYINKTIPVFYSFQGYEYNNPFSLSKQISKRVFEIPIYTAHLYHILKHYFDKNTLIELEKQMFINAQQIYGSDNGRVFIENYLKYKELYGKFIFKD
jgi:glycosyltransferase involved in cell wall biosynthesis/SAM-dependent methyltransferase